MINTLKNLGFSQKEIDIYLYLIKSGPNPVRKIALNTGINRGTTYDILKSLIAQGLISYHNKDRHKYFAAEDPDKLQDLVKKKISNLNKIDQKFSQIIPELKSLYDKEEKPVVKYYEGQTGSKTILTDLLATMSKAKVKEYFVFSSSDIAKYLYVNYKNFAEERIKHKIKVKVIAIGPGGKLYGLDQRKWLAQKKSWPTYVIIYHNKVAMFSLDSSQKLHGIIIEDQGTAATQAQIFHYVWKTLK
ncbi:TrmB family transcriptional regulator [Patescibacteria group bacterium]|nr:TrmB family transcriptional regulator [Patescibacteria group bacterium]